MTPSQLDKCILECRRPGADTSETVAAVQALADRLDTTRTRLAHTRFQLDNQLRRTALAERYLERLIPYAADFMLDDDTAGREALDAARALLKTPV